MLHIYCTEKVRLYPRSRDLSRAIFSGSENDVRRVTVEAGPGAADCGRLSSSRGRSRETVDGAPGGYELVAPQRG
jgi:hypothetical protein